MDKNTTTALNNKINNEETTHIFEYAKFYQLNIDPKINELVSAENSKQRRKIQKEIIALIRNRGFNNEATRLKAIFNV